MKVLLTGLKQVFGALFALTLLLLVAANGSGHNIPAKTNWTIFSGLVLLAILYLITSRFKERYRQEAIKEKFMVLANSAKAFGLPQTDVDNALEYLDYKEFEVGFELLVTQLYEKDIEIDRDLYIKLVDLGNELKIYETQYSSLKQLIRP